MPTYTFECSKCNHIFEKQSSLGKLRKTAKCPCCGKSARKIILPGAGFILRGEGWPGKEISRRKDG